MANLTRREFLLSLATVPLLGLRLPQLQLMTPGSGLARQGDPSLPNFIIMVFDTFSARHLPLSGYPRDTTPNISRLAERATVFHNHYAGGNYTTPGTASLLTGLYPWSHRSLHMYGHALDSVEPVNLFSQLPDTYQTVAYTQNALASALLHQFREKIDELKPRRELTLADGLWSDVLFPNDYPISIHAERLLQGVSLTSPPFMAAINRLYRDTKNERLSARYEDQFPRGLPGGHPHALYAHFVLENVLDWLTEQTAAAANPFAYYVHLLPPHGPYKTRHEFIDIFDDGWTPPTKEESLWSEGIPQERLNYQRRTYDEFIAYVDAEFARLFNMLESNGTLDNTYLILTSDHGELFERGIAGHSTNSLNDPILNIPLFIWKPGQTERVDVFERTSAVDIVPTLLHLAGQPAVQLHEGAVLPTLGGDDATFADRAVYAVEAKTNSKFAPLNRASLAMYQGPYKLINYRGYEQLPSDEGLYQLFNLDNDPEELEDLYSTERGVAEAMTEQLQQRLEEANRPFQRS